MKRFAKVFGGVSAAAVGTVAGVSSAAVDIATAVTGSLADIATAGGLILGVVVAVAAFNWVRKVIH